MLTVVKRLREIGIPKIVEIKNEKYGKNEK